MTIERAYVASCDGCEDIFEDDDCMQAWIFESELRAAMKRRGWTESDGETLCKHCARVREGRGRGFNGGTVRR